VLSLWQYQSENTIGDGLIERTIYSFSFLLSLDATYRFLLFSQRQAHTAAPKVLPIVWNRGSLAIDLNQGMCVG